MPIAQINPFDLLDEEFGVSHDGDAPAETLAALATAAEEQPAARNAAGAGKARLPTAAQQQKQQQQRAGAAGGARGAAAAAGASNGSGGLPAAAGGAATAADFYRAFQHVYRDPASGEAVLRFHRTPLLRVRAANDVALTTGGWRTHATLLALNDGLRPLGMRVRARGGPPQTAPWVLVNEAGGGLEQPFEDGMVVRAPRPEHAARDAAAKALISAYNGGAEVPRYVARPSPAVQAAMAAAPSSSFAPAAASSSSTAAGAAGGGSGGGGGGGGSAVNFAHAAAAASGAAAAMAASRGPQQQQQQQQQQRPSSSTAGPELAVPTWDHAPAGASTAAAAAPAGGSSGGGGGGAASSSVHEQLQAAMRQLGMDDDEPHGGDEHLCVVCLERERDTVLVPCGHLALCADCCHSIRSSSAECPLCREAIVDSCRIGAP